MKSAARLAGSIAGSLDGAVPRDLWMDMNSNFAAGDCHPFYRPILLYSTPTQSATSSNLGLKNHWHVLQITPRMRLMNNKLILYIIIYRKYLLLGYPVFRNITIGV
jgi:hypothetical protein